MRSNGEYYAIGAYCTHYQAPLADGILSGNQIISPWHNAYFQIDTGDQQEPPGLDSLPCYSVRVENEDVIVTIPQSCSQTRTRAMAEYNSEIDKRTFVILGAGAAGAHAAETLRIEGFQGRVIMVTQEDRIPYDRTWLSKDYFIVPVFWTMQFDFPLRYVGHAKESPSEIGLVQIGISQLDSNQISKCQVSIG